MKPFTEFPNFQSLQILDSETKAILKSKPNKANPIPGDDVVDGNRFGFIDSITDISVLVKWNGESGEFYKEAIKEEIPVERLVQIDGSLFSNWRWQVIR